MTGASKTAAALAAMRVINRDWINGDVNGLRARVHPDVAMAMPGFSATVQGRDAFLDGFRAFLDSAMVEKFSAEDLHADVAGETAVVTFRYEMIYQRLGGRYLSTGRDLWVFQRQDGNWIAVWRTMLEMQEHPV